MVLDLYTICFIFLDIMVLVSSMPPYLFIVCFKLSKETKFFQKLFLTKENKKTFFKKLILLGVFSQVDKQLETAKRDYLQADWILYLLDFAILVSGNSKNC